MPSRAQPQEGLDDEAPFSQRQEPIGYLLKRVQYVLRMAMDDQLRNFGLSTPQYAALWSLRKEPGLSGAELARRCFVRPQTMSEIVAHLEERQLVERTPHPFHRRVVETRPTQRALELLDACDESVQLIHQRMLGSLTAQQRQELADSLLRCAESLERWTPETGTSLPS